MAESTPRLGLFQGVGVEIELMIVDAHSLDVAPVADWLLTRVSGELREEVPRGRAAWSNELVLHVIEFKGNGPLASLGGAPELFQDQVRDANALLAERELALMPTGMHPWMDPYREMRLWPHGGNEIYAAFDRIFDCRGHGWANLQSIHINLPFADDAEFARLHAAIRVLLPLLPALAASTPLMDGALTGLMDSRLSVYRGNCARIPSITGDVIPEPLYTQADYEREILQRMYRDIAPFDPEGTLQEEWLNARGAIARFERNTVEIRVLDVQECPAADLAVVDAVVETLRALAEEAWGGVDALARWPVASLAELFRRTVERAGEALVDDPDYARLFGYGAGAPVTAATLWSAIIEWLVRQGRLAPGTQRVMEHVLSRGCLAARILAASRPGGRARIEAVYRRLCDCLTRGELFS